MTDELTFDLIDPQQLPSNQCPWFAPRYGDGPEAGDQVLLALLGGVCVCYALFHVSTDIELKYVANAPDASGRGYARQTVQELARRYSGYLLWAVVTGSRAAHLLRVTGFHSPEEVTALGGFRFGGAWVRYPHRREG